MTSRESALAATMSAAPAPQPFELPSAHFLEACRRQARRSIGDCDVVWNVDGYVQISAESSAALLARFDEFIDRWWLDHAPRELDVVLTHR